MTFKSGITEASKKNVEKIKGRTQSLVGGFCGFFLWDCFVVVVWLGFCCWLAFMRVGVVGFCCFLQFVGHFVLILFFHSVVFTKSPNCQKNH